MPVSYFSRVVKTRLPLLAVLLLTIVPASAQWITQSLDLKAGWNAVFLHVDASYTTLDALVAADASNPIIEVWRWNPPSTTQFTDSPQNPNAGSEWTGWIRTQTGGSLQRLLGDVAYLVRVGTNAATYTWTIKGRPVVPRHEWTITGLNFVGFPTLPSNPPRFDAFLAQSPELQTANPEIYSYNGGDLGPNNPSRLLQTLYRNTPVKRGQAFWIRSGTVFNRYFGPFEVALSSPAGVDFRDNVSAYALRLRNLSISSLTINLRLTPSETPPPGQSNIVATPPMLIRGALNTTNLTYGYTNLPTASVRSWTLAARGLPGSEIEVVLGLNRSLITANPGSLLAGVLEFTDSLGQLRVDVPVSAVSASSAGLWVGGASVNQVRHYLKSYERDAANNPVATPDGNYVVTNLDTSLGGVPRAFPLRLIVHNPEVGNAVLLQRVFYGLDANTNLIVATGESALAPAYLKDARRISAVHLPWTSTNTAWLFNGRLRSQTNLTATVALGYDDQASNPFLHSYHPDHDNLNETFKTVRPQGSESYSVQRDITLNVTPPADDFSSLVAAGLKLTGDYTETITVRGLARAGGLFDTRQFEVHGVFSLNRVSDTPTLALAP
jgi:hypothetical protein